MNKDWGFRNKNPPIVESVTPTHFTESYKNKWHGCA